MIVSGLLGSSATFRSSEMCLPNATFDLTAEADTHARSPVLKFRLNDPRFHFGQDACKPAGNPLSHDLGEHHAHRASQQGSRPLRSGHDGRGREALEASQVPC